MSHSVNFNANAVIDLFVNGLITSPLSIRADLGDSHVDASLADDGTVIYVSIFESLGLGAHLEGLGSPEKDEIGQSLRLGRMLKASEVEIDNNF